LRAAASRSVISRSALAYGDLADVLDVAESEFG